MGIFEIRDAFYLNGQPFKILSGAIHYFRIDPDDWYHSLFNLKALGFNTVETYVPWNAHEPYKGQFDFSGRLDIERFIQTAQSLGLYMIVRPSPFICAEWEFGGLPAWLLEEDMRIRSSDPAFIKAVSQYYDRLLGILTRYQVDQGGPILMMQVENEYGSYGEDKTYLRAVRDLMKEKGVTCPLFTSDGPWRATLRAGTLIEDDVFVTGNFGSKASYNFAQMQEFFDEHGKKWPLMCMEFWDGWFTRWKEPVIHRDPEELAEAVHEVLELGSINLYMFHGGTNFGFMNGCSARGTLDLPQVTSYDYGALLNEQGNPTEKYYAIQKMMATYYPQYPQQKPLIKECLPARTLSLTAKTSLFANVHNIAQTETSLYPKRMEELGQHTGYLLYETDVEMDAPEERLRIIDGRDRAQVYVNDRHLATQYQTEIGKDLLIAGDEKESVNLKILLENMGRVNYGHKLLADSQRKGIRTGVCVDLHFHLQWKQYPLELQDLSRLDFSKEWQENAPAFYRFDFRLDRVYDTYIDMMGYGKGAAFVNGHNLGRFWEVGPTTSLYVPHGFLKEGDNTIIVFETEGRYQETLQLVQQPTFLTIKGENL
uniref:glycoside hydrolase family 35 protein n=1 Tax=uncultured Streptococcus sp. TaxID=83427 RepID=UPI0025D78533|nr:glycoside hydrolase family 35 protein [uncultured Streptococcus sp.]